MVKQKTIISSIFISLLFGCSNNPPQNNNCNFVQFDSIAYKDSSLSFISWFIDRDTLLNWPKQFISIGKNEIFDVSERVISNKLFLSDLNPKYKISDSCYADSNLICMTAKDSIFINEVIKNVKEIALPKKLSSKVTIMPIDSAKHLSFYYGISLPIFSKDYSIVIVNVDMNCLPECGYGSQLVFIRKKGKWNLVQNNMTWIN